MKFKAQILKSQASKDEKQILEPNIRTLHENDEEMKRQRYLRASYQGFESKSLKTLRWSLERR